VIREARKVTSAKGSVQIRFSGAAPRNSCWWKADGTCRAGPNAARAYAPRKSAVCLTTIPMVLAFLENQSRAAYVMSNPQRILPRS
jgi:hypothetical protein